MTAPADAIAAALERCARELEQVARALARIGLLLQLVASAVAAK